jgi:hypothetical protein
MLGYAFKSLAKKNATAQSSTGAWSRAKKFMPAPSPLKSGSYCASLLRGATWHNAR